MQSSKANIALISKSGPQGGGASRVASQLHGLLNATWRFHADHWTTESNPPASRKSLNPGGLFYFAFRCSRYLSRKAGCPDFINLTRLAHKSSGQPYSLYHVHDISSAVSPFLLPTWSKRAPVVWTFHDCSPFTGGCIHPMSCHSYPNDCGSCPQLSNWPMLSSLDHTSAIKRYKLSIINSRISAVICPSNWIAVEAKKSGVQHELLHIIPNAVDTNIFFPKIKSQVRNRLGLPEMATIIFLGSVNLSNPYKGTEYALSAISHFGSQLNVLIVGKNKPNLNPPEGPTYHFRDFTSDRAVLADYYAACDLFLLPSLAENFPLMLLEAMACGTPTIGFATGGIVEAIEHMDNGWLVPTGEVEGLVAGIQFALSKREYLQHWSISARETVMSRYTEDRFLQSHIALYEKVLGKCGTS